MRQSGRHQAPGPLLCNYSRAPQKNLRNFLTDREKAKTAVVHGRAKGPSSVALCIDACLHGP